VGPRPLDRIVPNVSIASEEWFRKRDAALAAEAEEARKRVVV
jgi:hypothetical protein